MNHNVTVAITVYGKVQGVGFRPLVCRLAKENELTGFVRNAGTHVEITATGLPDDIQQLCDSLHKAEPPVRVDKIYIKRFRISRLINLFLLKARKATKLSLFLRISVSVKTVCAN